jgi:5-methylcytosine-specific restriction enzyme A
MKLDTIEMFLNQGYSVEKIIKLFPHLKKAYVYKKLRLLNLKKYKSDAKNLLYQSAEWKELRKKVMHRDNYMCTKCKTKNSITNSLQVEHVKPKSIYPELMFDLNNVITLCKRCHAKTITFGRAKLRKYAKKLKQR